MNNIFTCMNPDLIAECIKLAKFRIVYISSSLNEVIASAIASKCTELKDDITVILDVSETVCHFGYGTALGYELLQEAEIEIQRVENLRIGCLIVDHAGWVFTPTPLLLEADKVIDTQPNAIKVLPEQILMLLQSAAPKQLTEDEKDDTDCDPDVMPASIKTEQVSKQEIIELTQKLEKNPPQKFDISRKVNVFNTMIEFVELSLIGASVSKQTVRIPAKLLVGGVDKAMQSKLRTGYSVLPKDSKLSGKHLNDRVNDVRNTFTRSIHRFGRVALKDKRKHFDKALSEIEAEIEQFQNELRENLEGELDKQKNELAKALIPAIKDNPPLELTGQIPGDKPAAEQAERYMKQELDAVFPKAEDLIKEMKLHCVFKGVTYETLKNEEFQTLVQQEFPLVPWDRMFREFNAISSNK